MTPQKKKKKWKREKKSKKVSHALRTLRVHKKIENFADKNSQKNKKNWKITHKKIIKLPTLSSSSFYFYFYFSCFMLLMLLAKIFMFILNNICHTLLSILVLRIWVLNQTTFPTGTFPYPRPPPPPPPFCLKCIAVVRRSFFLVSTAVERIKQDEQLLMCNWSDSRQGENALNTKLLQFLSFIKLCDSKSSVVRI